MLADNIKALRKQKGYSQETLAQQLNVVRQTVSKWEKGLSVPDAEMLARLAELFEVPVSTLLDSAVPELAAEPDSSAEVARQLAILNEHFARQTARRKRAWKIVLWVIVGILVLNFLLVLLFGISYSEIGTQEELRHVEMLCTLDGEDYLYEIWFNDQYQIRSAGGDSWVADHVMPEQYGDANVLMAQMEDYFTQRGGSVEFSGDVP